MSRLETDCLSGLGSAQETTIAVTEGIPTNDGKFDKYQPGFDIEHPQRLKRRRRAKSTDSSAQTNFSNLKDVTLPINFADVLSQRETVISSDSSPTSQYINGGGLADDSDTAGSEIQERKLKRPRRAKSTENFAHMSPSNVKEASLAMANSSDVSRRERRRLIPR
ncbi:hypothetical protein V500_00561 [Pseudogymnoascus sp. VKM F-4518 (FW-2643)]|nr:hypothetical protein V500_00561 [Pseudogymnoascus sp. VKM F-4518 (FW-2643)]